MIPDSLARFAVPIDTLTAYAGNPRRGNVAVIAESLRVNGQYRPIVVNSRTRDVLAGNHTLAAARSLGWTEIAATYVDADEQQAARIVAADNRTADLGGYDDHALAELLTDLPELAGTGYDQEALDVLLASLAGAPEHEPVTPPEDFGEYGEDIETAYTCPRCQYSWSGKAGG